MPYRGILEVEEENVRLQKTINALQAENKWLQEDSEIHRATVDAIKEKEEHLRRALAKANKAYKDTKEQLESLVALGRKMLEARDFYRNRHFWLMEQYNQYQQLLHSQELTNNTAATDHEDQDVAAGGSCSEAPATSLEGEQVHTVAPSPPRRYYSISLRVHAGVHMPTFLKPPAVLHLAFSCKSRAFADDVEHDENMCSINKQKVKLPCSEKKESQESPSRFNNWINRLCGWFWQ